MKTRFALILMLLFSFAGLLSADTIIFTGASTDVNFSVNNPNGGIDYPDYLSSTPINGSFGSAGTFKNLPWGYTGFRLSATDPNYSDAGIVLFFNGGLTLGQLQSVNVATTSPSAMNINLWMDTGGDGKFFGFDSTGLLTGLNGDSYSSTSGTTLTANSSFYMQGGDGAGGTYTLQQLRGGAVSGIDGTTRTALWVGITNTNTADISSITVSATPEPASILLLGSSLIGIALVLKRRRV